MKRFLQTSMSAIVLASALMAYVASACQNSGATPQEHEFIGTSNQHALQAAFDDALKQLRQAMADQGIPDNQASWKLVEITGQLGGIAGLDELQVKITATFLTRAEKATSSKSQ